MAATRTTGKASTAESVKQLHYLASALKAPRITEAAERLADQARDAGWSFEDYRAASSRWSVAQRRPILLVGGETMRRARHVHPYPTAA